MDEPSIIIVPALIGVLISLLFRQYIAYETGQKGTLSTLFKDPFFEKYVTISVLSFLNSLYLGGATGAATGCVLAFMKNEGRESILMIYAICLLLSIISVRLASESVVLLFKVADKYLHS